MASLRPELRGRGRLGEQTQSKRLGAYMGTSADEFSSHLSRRGRKEAESARRVAQEPPPPQSKGPSKIPQTSSTRRQPIQDPSQRPSLGQQAPSWGSTSTTSNVPAKTSSKPPSTSQNGSKSLRNVLRRKQPSAGDPAASKRNEHHGFSFRSNSSSSLVQSRESLDLPQRPQLDRGLSESPAEIRMATRVELPSTNAQAVTIYPELDRYRDIRPQAAPGGHYFEVPYPISTDLPPPTPLFSAGSSSLSAFSGSPSTRYSESPNHSAYSRDTTPTSMLSQSPGLVAPMMRIPAPRSNQNSPANTRPPVTRRRAGSLSVEADVVAVDEAPGLAAVRESLASSSSNSTVRAATSRERRTDQSRAPSPPPRKSSRYRGRDESPSKSAREPAPPVMTARATPPVRSTPELPTSRMTPPVRPSRDGTPDLHSQLGASLPIIQSNLSTTSLAERRNSGTHAPSNLSRSATPLSQPDRQQQLSRPPLGREATPVPRVGGYTQGPQITKPDSRKMTRTPSPSVSSSLRSRFPMFGRRTKTATDVPVLAVETNDKPSRKCPAAGTGHEGYGRLGAVRRRSSGVANNLRVIPGTMSSQESLASNQSHDAFFKDRMSPVIIAGGEVIENRNASSDLSRTESNQSLALPRPSFGSQNSSQVSLSSQEARNTLWPSALPRGAAQGPPSVHRRRPSDSSDDGLAMKSTLAFRRSVQRLQPSGQQAPVVPKPITIRSGAPSPSVTSHDTTVLTDDSLYDSRPEPVRGRTQIGTIVPKKLTKRAKSPRKWNLFGRSQGQPVNDKKQPGAPKVPVAVKTASQKPVAFYTMMDSEQESDAANVEEVLREARAKGTPAQSPQVPSWGERRVSIRRDASPVRVQKAPEVKKREMTQRSGIIPPVALAPKAASVSSQPSRVTQQSTAPKPTVGRPSRLPQVGRIPKVISARPEQVSSRSFSRPFNRSSVHLPSPNVEVLEDEHVAKGPSPLGAPTPTHELTEEGSPTLTGGNSNFRLSKEFPSVKGQKDNEFLRFSPGKDSQDTSTTGSSNCSSGMLTFSDATAVIPDAHAPLAEDEVWDEYDDLLGENGMKVPPSAGSSQGRPFHLEMWGKALEKERDEPLNSLTFDVDLDTDCETEFDADTQVGLAPPVSSVYSSGMTAKINAVLEAAGGASFSVSDFVTGYGDRNNSADMGQPQMVRNSTSSSQKGREVRQSAASGSSQGSDDTSPLSQVNLRVGSMTVSKWLTFGHVLFSPVRDELVPLVGSLKRHSILVIDGLGNDDWSFYAAETYPAATFFNLSPRKQLPTDRQNQNSSSAPLSPPNHHQIQYNSHIDKFPFGPQSFTAVVYRFPVAVPESHYRNIVNEARRVLKPGGYLELMILDVDLNNMGNRGRRAVRQLKERIHIQAPDTSLGSSADLILRLLGRKGFEDIKTCRVGVPVGNAISPSTNAGGAGMRRQSKRETRSLAEMMSDTSPVADENITKMVAKVGRWWYNRCYESAGNSNKTMWDDRALLAECEEWKTSLKLMVCHARLPDGRTSRVASI